MNSEKTKAKRFLYILLFISRCIGVLITFISICAITVALTMVVYRIVSTESEKILILKEMLPLEIGVSGLSVVFLIQYSKDIFSVFQSTFLYLKTGLDFQWGSFISTTAASTAILTLTIFSTIELSRYDRDKIESIFQSPISGSTASYDYSFDIDPNVIEDDEIDFSLSFPPAGSGVGLSSEDLASIKDQIGSISDHIRVLEEDLKEQSVLISDLSLPGDLADFIDAKMKYLGAELNKLIANSLELHELQSSTLSINESINNDIDSLVDKVEYVLSHQSSPSVEGDNSQAINTIHNELARVVSFLKNEEVLRDLLEIKKSTLRDEEYKACIGGKDYFVQVFSNVERECYQLIYGDSKKTASNQEEGS